MDELTFQEQFSYAWENLWFLRPQWFWAFIPVALIALFFLLSQQRQSKWKQSFAKHLLPYLTIKGSNKQFILPKFLLLVLLSLMIISATGPTWEQIERPGNKTEAVLVVLLDLSRSMLAEDIQPNRIERAKLKIKDLFNSAPNVKTALIAFAGTAHTVVPFSKDYRTVSRQMEALTPSIMPIQGSNISEALDLADTLLSKIVAPSTILLVTDNIQLETIDRLNRTASKTHVEIMAIGTPNGATIPSGRGVLKDKSGNTIIPRLDIVALNSIGQIENVNIVTITLDDSDVNILANHIRRNLEFIIDPENAEEEWKDTGYWLLFPITFICLFWFRRGWLVHWCWILLFMSSCSDGNDLRVADLFFTKNQQGQRLYKQGEKELAAERFESGDWKGYTYYEMGNLEAAAEAYSQNVSANGFYNLGIVYTKLGDLESAQQAFNTAAELDPELTQAKKNLTMVTVVLDSIAAAAALAESSSPGPKNQPKEFQEYTEQPDEKDSAQKSDEKYEGKGDLTEIETFEVDEDKIDIFEFDEQQVISQGEAQQTLLRQVNENPAIFLRRKFAYQNKKRKGTIKPSQEPW
jgi:Ca-activated chloride channel homolog